mmetsp:Transcript_18436/g.56335  ORF Transcript_18436/g.56335 Transcript_18436/m.56335 type:complete len:107 (-) Transcript_18436:76-396(-)
MTYAAIDIFIASFAVEFKGTTGSKRGSSFSAMIFQIWKGRKMHRGQRTCTPKVLSLSLSLSLSLALTLLALNLGPGHGLPPRRRARLDAAAVLQGLHLQQAGIPGP